MGWDAKSLEMHSGFLPSPPPLKEHCASSAGIRWDTCCQNLCSYAQGLDLCKNGVTCLSKQHVTTIAMSEKREFRKQDLQPRSRQFKGRNYKIMKEFQTALALSALIDIDCSISHVIRKPQHMDLKLKYKPIVSRHIQSNSTSVY